MFRPIFFLISTAICLSAAERIDFNRDVRPLLTKNCTTCHGGVKKAGDVSYLYREDVLGKGESGKTIAIPGNPEDSEMIRRLTTSDPDDRMPPPEHHGEALSADEIETLSRWIREGAEWGTHWAFQKPVASELPPVKDQDWPQTGLDHFILARLEAEELQPSAEARPAAWLRRVSLDLTGLPPTLGEWKTFQQTAVRDPQSAMEQAVDRLLASPAYGEHLASMWLDLARYSDTFGFEKDPHRDIWSYRDWVISAFNTDLPFDQFTIKQLAGDLIEQPEPGDLLASAFHRNTQNNTEGGTDDEEYRMAAVIDRVNTTWTAWNAVTFGCVQCHSHPYDPIPHDNYYQFLAFFNNSEDVDLNSDFPRTKVADNPADQADAVRLEQQIRSQRMAINASARSVAREAENWKVITATKTQARPDTGRVSQRADGDFVSSGTNPYRAEFTLTSDAEPFAAIKLTILPKSDDPAEWDERGSVVARFDAALIAADGSRRSIALREVIADFLSGPFDPNDSLKKNNSGFGDYPMMKGPRSAWLVPNEPVIPEPGDQLEITIHHAASCNAGNQSCILRRFRIELTDNPALGKFLARPERAADWKMLQQLRNKYNSIKGRSVPVMMERSDAAQRETRVFIRGNRSTLGKVVEPGISQLVGGPENASSRLDMANWLVGPENPLAARVLANRLWAGLFGKGIVTTLEDFGSSGALPSHPALLDHLALRLRIDHQWRLKPFLREIVLSSTYRQADRASPALLEKDPHNRLLARGPRQRLSAEMVRDQALLVSGLLSPKMAGPPVYPPQPDGIWRSVYSGQKWKTSKGSERNRRAIYTYSKRTSGYPAFLTFDAPTRDLCSARRIPTNTPLQALVTLNDPAHIEFAQALAKRMLAAAPELSAQLAHGYQLITLTEPSPEILDTLRRLHQDIESDYRKNLEESAKLAPSPTEAALVLVANTLLNSDFALNR